MRKVTSEQWEAEGRSLYGDDKMNWKFRCPSCGHVASVADWKAAGASQGEVAFSCVGRHLNANDKATFGRSGGPCNYAGGGLFKINPVTVDDGTFKHSMFEFADHLPQRTPRVRLKSAQRDEVSAEDQSASLTHKNNLGTVELTDD